MAEGEGPAVYDLCDRVLFDDDPNVPREVQRARSIARIEHPRSTDPGGAWVAERGGEVAGVALGIVRERLWGFSLFAVDEDLQGKGVGRELLRRSLAYGEERGAEGWIILSSERPAAMRVYAGAGFDLLPAIAAMGVADLRRAPDAVAAVDDAGTAGLPVLDDLGRAVRGAGYAGDVAQLLEHGSRLLVFEDRAAVCVREGYVQLLVARDEEAAAIALWAALVQRPSRHDRARAVHDRRPAVGDPRRARRPAAALPRRPGLRQGAARPADAVPAERGVPVVRTGRARRASPSADRCPGRACGPGPC